jgi:hypothetical protein
MRPVTAAVLGFAAATLCATAVGWLMAGGSTRTGGHPAQPGGRVVAEAPPQDGALLPPTESRPAPPRNLAPRPEETASTQQVAGAHEGTLLYGSLRNEAGQAIDDERAEVELVPATGPTLWAPIKSGTYSRMGLMPGEWTVRTKLTHYKPTSQAVTLADEPFMRLDIVLTASHRVEVRAFTPDGRPLGQVLAEMPDMADLASSLGVIASVDPLASTPELRQMQWAHWGIGRFWLRGDIGAHFDKVSMPDDCLGLLELSVPGPAWAHLMLGEALLASQPVAPDATAIAFTLSAEHVVQSLGSFAVRCLDAQTREPLSNSEVQLRTQDTWRTPEHTGPDGRWHQERITPGTYLFTANTQTSEHLTYDVAIPAGRTLDLGDVYLHDAVHLAGTVVDGQGQGMATSLRLRCLDQEGAVPIGVEFAAQQTDPQGNFDVRDLGPRRYVLTVIDDDFARHATFVDLSAGDVVGLRIMVVPGVTVSVRPDWPPEESHGLRILDVNGFLMGESASWSGANPFVRRLEPGRYTAEVFGAAGVERQQVFDVADGDLVVTLGS